MLRVPTYLAPSAIAGFGVFAAQAIPQGALLWELVEGVDVRLSPEQLKALPEALAQRLREYLYLDAGGFYVLCGDNARFINHAEDPNCEERPGPSPEAGTVTYARRDIQPGEELTNDYRSFDVESRQLGLGFEPS